MYILNHVGPYGDPKIIHFNGVFLLNHPFWGTPHFRKPSYSHHLLKPHFRKPSYHHQSPLIVSKWKIPWFISLKMAVLRRKISWMSMIWGYPYDSGKPRSPNDEFSIPHGLLSEPSLTPPPRSRSSCLSSAVARGAQRGEEWRLKLQESPEPVLEWSLNFKPRELLYFTCWNEDLIDRKSVFGPKKNPEWSRGWTSPKPRCFPGPRDESREILGKTRTGARHHLFHIDSMIRWANMLWSCGESCGFLVANIKYLWCGFSNSACIFCLVINQFLTTIIIHQYCR